MTENGKLEQAVRDRLAEAGSASVEQMVATLQEGLKAEKVANADITCKKCGHAAIYRVKVPDARAAAAVLDMWLTQSLGRPSSSESPEEQRTIVNYTVIPHCEGCQCADTIITETAGDA